MKKKDIFGKNSMNNRPEHNVFLNMFKLALTFFQSDKQILQELSHYIVDNLITKICIFVAKEKNLQYKTTSRSGKEITFDFLTLYQNILMREYPNVPDYDKEIKKLHELRNFFQHSSESIEFSIRKEFAEDYIKKVEKILNEIGVNINYIKSISSKKAFQDFLKEEYIENNEATLEQISEVAAELENFFKEKCEIYRTNSKESRFKVIEEEKSIILEIYLKIIPNVLIKRSLFKNDLNKLKEFLQNIRFGPMLDSIDQSELFKELSISRNFLYHCSKENMIGSLVINEKGFILYNWKYTNAENGDNILPTYYLSLYSLAFLNFIYEFYKKVEYNYSFRLIFDIKGIKKWAFSPSSNKSGKDHKYKFTSNKFIPIEKNIDMIDLKSIEYRFNIITDIFTEILGDFGYPKSFIIPQEIKKFYLKK
ncbi:MAG: hypothetical protein ACTSRH_09620 [Promethearchaeota archaeon]